MDYIIGQRWVSHADAQLGLGIVVDMEGRRVTLAFPAVGEERTYATDNAPLTRLRFKAGDHISTIENVELLVTETEPGFKGDTSSNTTKPALCETGLQVNVPLFVNAGDKLKIDTRTGDYVERVKG